MEPTCLCVARRQVLEGAKEKLEAIGWKQPLKDKEISADTGYCSVKNLEVCKDFKVDAYVPDPQFRKRDERFADSGRHRRSVDRRKERYKSKKRWFSVEDFKLDDRTGKLICPAGHGLYVKNRNFTTSDGHKAIAFQAPKTACRSCRLRSKCLRNPDTVSRQVHVFYGKRPGSLTDEMREKIDTEQGRRIYSKRLGIIEPVFGNIRSCKKMDRFTLRGRIKVNIQWMLYCLVHNIEKIVNPVRERCSLTTIDGGIELPSIRNYLYSRQESVAFSNEVNFGKSYAMGVT